ncbi:hypothetical protein V8G54_036331 [Vigna mungo]|uniref:Transposase MuDR plant domain-containing protein n=1 Tax=Vigna mungo TaxID=3915 RepID=A0AAQ3MGQ9_VIGMU
MSEERFNVVVHHGGTLVTDIPFQYVGGEVTYWSVDPDKWSYFEVVDSIKELGYMNVSELFYCIDHILYKLFDDIDAVNMVGIAKILGEVNLFVVHSVDEEPEITVESELNEAVPLLCLGSIESGNEEKDVQNVAVGVEDEVVVGVEDEVVVGVEDEMVVQVEDIVEENVGMEEEEVVVQVEDMVEQNVGVEEEEVVIKQDGQVEEEVLIEAFSSSDDAGVVHGEVPHGVVDEEEVNEGLVDVDVNIDEGVLHNEVQGLVSVEYSENESNSDSDTDDSGHIQTNPKDRELSDDDWESEALNSLEESESEDGVDERQSCGPFGTYVKQKDMSEYKWEVGTKFSDKNEFMEAVRSYVVHAGRNLKFLKNDNRRVRVRCLGAEKQCPWMAYCGYLEGCRTWQLRKILDTHTCSRQFNIKMMNAKWLSDTLDTTLLENLNLKINDIRSKALRKWNINVSLSKARRARLMASCKVEGSFKDQFTRIFDYAHELLRSNPGSTVKVKVNSETGQPIFQRFYVCLKACKNSFVSCRPFVGLDGCFLKGKYKGKLLTVVARDPNEHMLYLAYAIVEVENKETWSWFLELLIEDLGGTEVMDACTFMSDQQKVILGHMGGEYRAHTSHFHFHVFMYEDTLMELAMEFSYSRFSLHFTWLDDENKVLGEFWVEESLRCCMGVVGSAFSFHISVWTFETSLEPKFDVLLWLDNAGVEGKKKMLNGDCWCEKTENGQERKREDTFCTMVVGRLGNFGVGVWIPKFCSWKERREVFIGIVEAHL